MASTSYFRSKKQQEIFFWVATPALILLVAGVYIFDARTLKSHQENALTLLFAITSALVGAALPGQLNLTLKVGRNGSRVEASGSMALMVIVMLWWKSDLSPNPQPKIPLLEWLENFGPKNAKIRVPTGRPLGKSPANPQTPASTAPRIEEGISQQAVPPGTNSNPPRAQQPISLPMPVPAPSIESVNELFDVITPVDPEATPQKYQTNTVSARQYAVLLRELSAVSLASSQIPRLAPDGVEKALYKNGAFLARLTAETNDLEIRTKLVTEMKFVEADATDGLQLLSDYLYRSQRSNNPSRTADGFDVHRQFNTSDERADASETITVRSNSPSVKVTMFQTLRQSTPGFASNSTVYQIPRRDRPLPPEITYLGPPDMSGPGVSKTSPALTNHVPDPPTNFRRVLPQ